MGKLPQLDGQEWSGRKATCPCSATVPCRCHHSICLEDPACLWNQAEWAVTAGRPDGLELRLVKTSTGKRRKKERNDGISQDLLIY
jgi:hypothetical protein